MSLCMCLTLCVGMFVGMSPEVSSLSQCLCWKLSGRQFLCSSSGEGLDSIKSSLESGAKTLPFPADLRLGLVASRASSQCT